MSAPPTPQAMADELDALAESWRHPENRAGLMLVDPSDVAMLRDAAARLRQSCATCAHMDDRDEMIDGWTFCGAPRGDHRRYPFAYQPMPLDEKCKGWTARES